MSCEYIERNTFGRTANILETVTFHGALLNVDSNVADQSKVPFCQNFSSDYGNVKPKKSFGVSNHLYFLLIF